MPRYRVWERYDMPDFWASGRELLGTTVDAMRQRLLAGGLFGDEWEKVNIWLLGALGPHSPLGRSPFLQNLRIVWQWIVELAGKLPFWKKPQPSPGPPVPVPRVHATAHFHLFGLEVQTRYSGDLVAWSTMGIRAAPSFLFVPQALPPVLDPAAALRDHADVWALEHRRRQAILDVSSKIIFTLIQLLLKYVVLGPVGLVMFLIRLLMEGLLRAVLSRKKPILSLPKEPVLSLSKEPVLTWPDALPGMEIA
jgi:hypothetical protein